MAKKTKKKAAPKKQRAPTKKAAAKKRAPKKEVVKMTLETSVNEKGEREIKTTANKPAKNFLNQLFKNHKPKK